MNQGHQGAEGQSTEAEEEPRLLRHTDQLPWRPWVCMSPTNPNVHGAPPARPTRRPPKPILKKGL